ncbi:hypothetical protein B0I37DRAFT_365968 [Chaetomium sp. MPI-CAGE-AT-0009]|nr:hypothetical protein B0I37DRAFT_365968 [Chaetomium sp. MPI-CAGE-AT-0009]
MLSAGSSVRAKLGTPLAIATSFEAHAVIIFLNEDNMIRAVHTEKDGYYLAWKHSGLYGPHVSPIPVQPQSRLAAYWLHCIDCTESEDANMKIRLFFENEPGGLHSHLHGTEDSNFAATGRPGSGLAVTSLRSPSREVWLVLFFDTGQKLGMMTRKSVNDSAWVFDEAFSGATHPTFPGQQIVAGALEVKNANGEGSMNELMTFAVQLEKDGSLTATYWDPRTQKWTFGSPVELMDGPQPPPAFTQIAVMNRKFFGITDGTIFEYSISTETVTLFTFMGKPVAR